MGKAADFPTVVVTTAGVSVAAKTGYPVTGLPVRCEVPLAWGEGAEDPAWTIIFSDDAISLEAQ